MASRERIYMFLYKTTLPANAERTGLTNPFHFSQECLSACQDLIEDALQLNVIGGQDNEMKLGAEQPTTPTDLQAVDLS